MRDAFHLVLSMLTRTDPLSVQRAAPDFAKREFSGFQYAMVLHTFETDPDPHPSQHPHVHLTVKAAGLDGVRLNPRKVDLQRWRLLTFDEVRQFTDTILFIRNLPPIHAIKTSYSEVKPWSDWVAANPLFGSKLRGKTRVRLKY